PVDAATPEKRMEFNRAVMERVNMGTGGKSVKLGRVNESEFNNLVRGGAEYYVEKYGAEFDRSRAERHRMPVDDDWQIPWGGKGRPERGMDQLGSLGGGNHFIELQKSEETQTLFVQAHTGSRGFGHGLATNYFEMAKAERPEAITDIDLGYFTPDSKHYRDYLNAVAAGGNYAIINRLVIFEQVTEAFRQTFGAELELIYEISHNLVQREWHPEYGEVWVHRKGATRRLNQRKIDDEYRAAGILVNTDGRVPIDEAAPCYKSSEEVIEAVVGAGLATIEYRLWPLASLKGTDERKSRKRRKGRKPEK